MNRIRSHLSVGDASSSTLEDEFPDEFCTTAYPWLSLPRHRPHRRQLIALMLFMHLCAVFVLVTTVFVRLSYYQSDLAFFCNRTATSLSRDLIVNSGLLYSTPFQLFDPGLDLVSASQFWNSTSTFPGDLTRFRAKSAQFQTQFEWLRKAHGAHSLQVLIRVDGEMRSSWESIMGYNISRLDCSPSSNCVASGNSSTFFPSLFSTSADRSCLSRNLGQVMLFEFIHLVLSIVRTLFSF
jgi:hypothetical protein